MDAGSKEVWQVPVSLRAAGSNFATYKILSSREQAFVLPGCAPWVYANAGARGYYRTEYSSDAFSKMSAELEKSFSPEERIEFLGDAWAMVRSGRLSIGDYLDAAQSVGSDRNREVINQAMGVIPRIYGSIAAPADRPAFEAWVRKFLGPTTKELGPESVAGENPERAALRTDVLTMLTAYGNEPALIAKAKFTAEQYMKDPSTVDTASARAALRTVATTGGADLYDLYMEHMKSAKTPEEY